MYVYDENGGGVRIADEKVYTHFLLFFVFLLSCFSSFVCTKYILYPKKPAQLQNTKYIPDPPLPPLLPQVIPRLWALNSCLLKKSCSPL